MVEEATPVEMGLEDAKAILAQGRLVPPIDDITAGGYEMWQNNPPLYHDLSCMSYTKFDVQEWTGKIRKYKAEVVRYADQCRRLEKEVWELRNELEKDTGHFEGIEVNIQAAIAKTEELEKFLQEGELWEVHRYKFKLDWLTNWAPACSYWCRIQYTVVETARRNLNSAECISLRRARQDVLKQQAAMQKEIGETRGRIGLLKTEVERNRKKHLVCFVD